MAPWWLRSGHDLATVEDEAPDDAAELAEPAAVEELPAAGARQAETAGGEAGGPDAPGESAPAQPPKKRRRRRRRRKAGKAGGAEPPPEAPASRAPRGEAPPAWEAAAASPPAPAPPEPQPGLDVLRNLVYPLPERGEPIAEEKKIAMFCDFENIALGVRGSETKLDIHLILARLLEKGKIIVKKAYADWERYSDYKKPFHEAAIELIDIPQKYYSGKNSADIKMVVDAMDLCYSKEHLDTFVLVSGDSDFSPLVSKLKENDKYVIGVGVKSSSSNLLIDNCDEFIYYEDIWRDVQRAARLDNLSEKDAEVFGQLLDAMFALERENKDVLWGSMIKQTMKRKRPSFNEGYYGYRTFSELLEDAQAKGIVRLKRDQRSGNYIVAGLARPR